MIVCFMNNNAQLAANFHTMKPIITLFFTLIAFGAISQQTLTLPTVSPRSEVSQQIGITDITLVYHSPGVKGRKIWGNVVPYSQIWRAGADENTTISFTHEVSIGGNPLPAGTYGLHIIPTENTWTLIFSKNYSSWGSFFYKQEEDALRVTVTPNQHPYTEWLTYSFTGKTKNSATLSLIWENIEVPVTIDVDVNKVVINNIKNELRSTPGFTWQGWFDAANYCYENNIETAQALEWIETANRINPNNYSILQLKASLLENKGDSAEAKKIKEKALDFATENELNTYGYRLMGEGKNAEALKIFKLNAKQHPTSWNVHDSLGEALEKMGDKKEAIKAYEKALKNSPPDSQAKRIEQTIKQLKNG